MREKIKGILIGKKELKLFAGDMTMTLKDRCWTGPCPFSSLISFC